MVFVFVHRDLDGDGKGQPRTVDGRTKGLFYVASGTAVAGKACEFVRP